MYMYYLKRTKCKYAITLVICLKPIYINYLNYTKCIYIMLVVMCFAFIRTTMLLPLKHGFFLLLRLYVTYVLQNICNF